MNYFILLKYLYQFLLENEIMFPKDIKRSGNCLKTSLKLGIFVMAIESNCLAVPRKMNVHFN